MSLPLRIVFDFTCPYCYIAWGFVKKLKSSIAIEDEWVPWEIHPDVPQEGLTVQDIIPNIDLITRRHELNALGEPVGFTPGENQFVPNTHLALEIVEFAKENHKMHEWIDRVYHASFVEGKNIGDRMILLEIAREIGLDSTAIAHALDHGQYTPILLKYDQECVSKKVEWVPTLFSGDEKILEGVFTFAVFEETICSRIK